MFGKAIVRGLLVASLVLAASSAKGVSHAPWPIDWNNWSDPLLLATVGDPGNAGELSGSGAGGSGLDRVCGAVGYTYSIGKFEVTAGQYAAFLNAVAKTDTYGLYNAEMWSDTEGCKIQQSNSSGNYAYSVTQHYACRPVNFVSFWDACRFANWLHNGQPTGPQGSGTTETGAYTLTSDGITNNTVLRNADAKWAIASEDEWYKAAYYKGGGINAGYWHYATSSDTAPGEDMDDVSGNNANCQAPPYSYPIDSGTYYTTVAGEFQDSESPYGTFDQAGNVHEWNETIVSDTWRGYRGETYIGVSDGLLASMRHYGDPAWETGTGDVMGFRVVRLSVPEPGSVTMLAGLALAALLSYWRKHA
jgi:formylglycine-generating enzyme